MAVSALAAGFADPVREAQAVFRSVMMALARPATVRPMAAGLVPPAPLTPELAAVALALADHEAPLWLDAALAAEPAVVDFLRFHTGARIVTAPAEAAFALVADPAGMPELAAFGLGSDEYPDRSTTIVIAVGALAAGAGLAFEGPGIKGRAAVSFAPMPAAFAEHWRANRALFPRGVDVVLTAPGGVAGLPRSATLIGEV